MDKFVIAPYALDESNLMLRSNNEGAANYYLSTANGLAANCSWEYFLNPRFSLSGANFIDVWLVSDNADLGAAQNGFFIRYGRTQRDISVWKRSAGSDEMIIKGPDNQINSGSSNPVWNRITRNAEGFWTVQTDQIGQGNFQNLGFFSDSDFQSTEAFGFRITQSAAQGPINSHWFDAVLIEELPPDVTPPQILNAEALSATEIRIDFDEPLEASSAENTFNYFIDGGIGNPASAVFNTENLTQVDLTLATGLDEGQFYTLTVTDVEDLAGNAMEATEVQVIFFVVVEPQFRELVFNELMIDENPQVGLPVAEFIELYNTTDDKFFDLEGYTYVNGNDVRTLEQAVIFPGDYLLLCRAADAPLFQPFGEVLGLASWPLLTNSADSLVLKNVAGDVLDIVSYTVDWYQDPDKEGGGWTLEQINPFEPCNGMHNWRAAEDPSGGTPGAINSIFDDSPDTTAPEVTGFEQVAPEALRILFSEPIDEQSMLDGAYAIDPQLNIVQILPRFDLTAVNLFFDEPLAVGVTYTLSISGLTDCAGNPLPDGTEVEVLFGEKPLFGDVIISEIMADPTPAVGLPPQEYFELFNASDKVIDIQGCDLSGRGFIFPRLLMPGEYLMCVSSNALDDFQDFPDAYVMQSMSLTFFTNAGRELVLTNQDGELVNEVTYSNTWYRDPAKAGGGWALEIINPFTECSGAQNWIASNSSTGGTPGEQNSVFDDSPDTTPPVFTGFFAEAPNRIVLNFNELMDEESLINGSYIFDEGIAVIEATPLDPPTRVELLLGEELEVGPVYILTVNGLLDCSLNPLPETTVEIQLGVAPELHDLIFSEVMANPTPSNGLPPSEYFELYNASDKVIELQGCDFSGRAFERARLVQPGEYVLCVSESQRQEWFEFQGVYFIDALSASFITNSGRELLLSNPDGEMVDRIRYDLTWYNDPAKEGGGWSLERINLEEPCRGSDNWTASIAQVGGTPQAVNSVNSTEPDLEPPLLVQALVLNPQTVEVRFSEVIDPESLELATFEINGIEIIAREAIQPDNKAALLQLAQDLEQGPVYTLVVNGVADCSGNLMLDESSLNIAVPEEGLEGDIIINEVLFNSGNDGVDFIEIVNISTKNIGLQNWVVQNINLTTRTITTDPVIIFPGEYMVFTANPDLLHENYPLGRRETFVTVSTPQLTNAGGAVIIGNAFQSVIDRFDYSEDFHLSLLRSFRGVSLERLSFKRPTNDPGNWISAAEHVGFATPGYLNSQFLPEGQATDQFELENEVFSPDNDGFQDVLLINYKLENPGYIANIQIFDRRGRMIRNLVSNQVIGTEGTISWDGTTDQRSKARIGPHIVYVELFDLQGRTEYFKLPCIVAGRLSN